MSAELKAFNRRWTVDGGGDSQWEWIARPGGWWIGTQTASDGSQTRVRVFAQKEFKKIRAQVKGRVIQAEQVESVRPGAGSSHDSAALLTAQFPGKVRKILVQNGAVVSEDQELIRVEAMKMEFTIKAPAKGRITRVLVDEGQSISPGDRFVDWEPAQ